MIKSNKEVVDRRELVGDRRAIIDYLNKQLIGPSKGATEEERASEELLINDTPQTYYLMGALFPQGVGMEDSSGEEQGDQSEEDPIALAYQLKPASIGLSFFLNANHNNLAITVSLAAAVYETAGLGWRRRSLATRANPLEVTLSLKDPHVAGLLDGRADVLSKWRKLGSGYLVTVTLLNTRIAAGKLDASDVLHQVWMRCSADKAKIGIYPQANRFSWDEEEEELALIYQNKRAFAIGHGCAANWPLGGDEETPEWVETIFIPEYEVPPVTANLPKGHELAESPAFSLKYLADPRIDWDEKSAALGQFIDSYESWVEDQASIGVPKGLEGAAGRIMYRLRYAVARMKNGLKYLDCNPGVVMCFELANRVMLMQMIHSGSVFGGTIKDANSFVFERPDYTHERWSGFRWRPFQLAFQLLSIESVANSNSDDRQIADLIWFPTGGGKTEAYLAVSAFELFHRRYRFGEAGGGTCIILRYTLRLLTTQQFERAAAMICACELVRRENPEKWGSESFSLGLWVGQATTPNSFSNESAISPGALQK